MFGHPKQALGQIEHLPFLLIDHAAPVEIRAAMPASRRSVFDHGVGFDDLPQRVALVALLSPARLARARAQTAQNARLPLQPVARRGSHPSCELQKNEVKGLKLLCRAQNLHTRPADVDRA
jgi:hypothetical protein